MKKRNRGGSRAVHYQRGPGFTSEQVWHDTIKELRGMAPDERKSFIAKFGRPTRRLLEREFKNVGL